MCFVYFWLWGSNERMDGRRRLLLLLMMSLLCKDKCQRKSKPEEKKGVVLSRTPRCWFASHVCMSLSVCT